MIRASQWAIDHGLTPHMKGVIPIFVFSGLSVRKIGENSENLFPDPVPRKPAHTTTGGGTAKVSAERGLNNPAFPWGSHREVISPTSGVKFCTANRENSWKPSPADFLSKGVEEGSGLNPAECTVSKLAAKINRFFLQVCSSICILLPLENACNVFWEGGSDGLFFHIAKIVESIGPNVLENKFHKICKGMPIGCEIRENAMHKAEKKCFQIEIKMRKIPKLNKEKNSKCILQTPKSKEKEW